MITNWKSLSSLPRFSVYSKPGVGAKMDEFDINEFVELAKEKIEGQEGLGVFAKSPLEAFVTQRQDTGMGGVQDVRIGEFTLLPKPNRAIVQVMAYDSCNDELMQGISSAFSLETYYTILFIKGLKPESKSKDPRQY